MAFAPGYTIVSPRIVELSFISATGTTALAGTVSYSGTSVHDIAANLLAPVNKSVVDKASPVIIGTKLFDSNGNGKIDGIRFGFPETLVGTSSGVIASVAGYVVTGYTISGTGLTAVLAEGANPDTGATPLVLLQNTTLADVAGNTVASE